MPGMAFARPRGNERRHRYGAIQSRDPLSHPLLADCLKGKSSGFDLMLLHPAHRDAAGHHGDVVAAFATAFNAAVMAWTVAPPS
jgi:hypothetical protein